MGEYGECKEGIEFCPVCGNDLRVPESLHKIGTDELGSKYLLGHYDSSGRFIQDCRTNRIFHPYSIYIQCSVCDIAISLGVSIRWVINLPIDELPLLLDHKHPAIRDLIRYRIEYPDFDFDSVVLQDFLNKLWTSSL